MTSKSLLAAIGVCGVVLFFHPQKAQTGELIFHDGGSMTVESGSTLLLNCNTTTIESGGTFTLNGGTVEKLGKLIVETGGHYTKSSGTVKKCYRSYYVIPGPNGKKAIICL